MNSKTIKEKQKSLPKKENIEDAEKEKKKKMKPPFQKVPKQFKNQNSPLGLSNTITWAKPKTNKA